ncbi:Fc receptor-like protein 5 [Maylandia zebra]|uniref:Fc receptor-like protein 5 n=1 Tax=Maylandia zebra TaxID=106582 RepID=UPI00403CE398
MNFKERNLKNNPDVKICASMISSYSVPSKPTVTLQPSWTQTYSGETVTVRWKVMAAVKLQHSWSQIFTGETITLRCEIQGGEGKVWKYEWTAPNTNSPPTSSEYRISRVSVSHSGDYRCRGSSDYLFTGWSDAFRLTVSFPSKPTVTLQPSWTQIYSGETVTVRCEIQGGEGAQWTYEWRAAKLNTPPTSNEYRIIRATESDSGGYSCRGRRDYFFSEWSDIITLTVSLTASNRPVVTLYPNWSEIYRGETITVRCEIHGGDTEWDYEWETNSMIKAPNQNEYRIRSASSSNSGNYRCKGRMKSSQHETTEWSDSVTLTVSDNEPRPVLTVSPSWLSPGASVTLNCEVEHPSAGWSFYWYKAVPDLSEKSSSYELLPDGSGTAQDSYIIHGQTHTAGYVCRAGRGDPEYHTDHSQPKFVWSAALTFKH